MYGYTHQKLQPLVLWEVAKRNSHALKLICNLVNILSGNISQPSMSAVRESEGKYQYELCNNHVTNIAKNFIITCQPVCTAREEKWDNKSSNVDIRLNAVL